MALQKALVCRKITASNQTSCYIDLLGNLDVVGFRVATSLEKITTHSKIW